MKKIYYAFLLFFPLVSFSQTTGNYALDFDGGDDYVTLPDALYATNLANGSAITIEYWFKGSDLQSAVRFQDGPYIVAGWTSPPIFIISTDGGIENGVAIGGNVEDGNWHHVACVWQKNTTNGFQTFVDGVLSNQRNSADVNLPSITSGAWLGSLNGTQEFINGSLDEVRIWNDVRTPFEIREYMFKDLDNTDNLVAYYKMSNGSGTSLTDNSVNSNTGTITNGTSWVGSGCWVSPGNALDFDGSSDYIDFGTSSPPYSNSTLTIEAWIKTNMTSYAKNILSWGNSSGDISDNVQIRIDGGKLTFGSDPGSGWQWVISSQSINTGSWVHVAVVKNGSSVQLYINGVLDNSGENTNLLMSVDRMVIGTFYQAGAPQTGYYFDGLIDEVRIWNTARSATEIQDGMFSNYNGNWSGIEAMYRMNQMGSETVFIDGSSNGKNGTMTNFADPASSWVQSTTYNTWIGFTSDISTTTNWATGSVPGSTNSVNITGGSPNTFGITSVPAAPLQCDNLNVKTNSILTINDGKALTVNGNLCNNGTLTINSSSSGTGSLIVGGEAFGSITFQRYADVYSKGQKWHYLSAPVAGQALTTDWMSDNNIGLTESTYQFFRFSEISNYWIYFDYVGSEPEDFGDETFVDARGYCLTRTSDGVLSFTGTPITDDITYAATYTANQGKGFNLVGNPFTSAIGVTSDAGTTGNFLAANAALLDDSYEALYVWDEASGYTFGSQDYKVISNAGITGHTSISQDFIAPGQAFMVKVVSADNLTFNTNMQAHSSAAAYKSKEIWPSVELTINGNGNSNSTALCFNSEMTDGLDPSYDAAKFKGNPKLALYTKLVDDNGNDFAIQALPNQNIEDYIIPIGVDVAESAVFEFSATQEKLNNYSLLLEDRQENTFTDLRWNTYFATISESGTGRFYLHFKDATAIGEIAPETKISFTLLDGKIVIHNPDKEKGTIRLVNVSGQVLNKMALNGNDNQEFSINQAAGIYVISIQTENTVLSKKVFVN